jgi:hypothetical protein
MLELLRRKNETSCLKKIYEQTSEVPLSPLFPYGEKLGKRVKRVEVFAEFVENLGEEKKMLCACKDGCGKTFYLPLFDIPVIGKNGKIIGYKKLRAGKTYVIQDWCPFIDARGSFRMIEF